MDGYLGWSLALYLAEQGHEVGGIDAYYRRDWVAELGSHSIARWAFDHDCGLRDLQAKMVRREPRRLEDPADDAVQAALTPAQKALWEDILGKEFNLPAGGLGGLVGGFTGGSW